jgi:hypothetical protein
MDNVFAMGFQYPRIVNCVTLLVAYAANTFLLGGSQESFNSMHKYPHFLPPSIDVLVVFIVYSSTIQSTNYSAISDSLLRLSSVNLVYQLYICCDMRQ